jgi:multidrug efflux pump subunit AcrA (membrane-fusion protein)
MAHEPNTTTHTFSHEDNVARSSKPLILVVLIMLIVFGAIFAIGWLERRGDHEANAKQQQADRNDVPVVDAAVVNGTTTAGALTLPGTTIPETQAYVYARANGYVSKRFVDIGDHVREGQLLATIDAPDLDAQVIQAREQLAQAQQVLAQTQSQLTLATVTVQRYRVLVQKGVFSRQDGDTQEANYSSQVANVDAAKRNVEAFKANLEHQVALQRFEQVRAPFSGVITERDVDVGALVSGPTSGAGSPAPTGQVSSAGGSAQAALSNNAGAGGAGTTAATSAQSPGQGGPLFGIAQLNRLRILVSVPESYATAVHVGQSTTLAFEEQPGQHFTALVTRTANSIDPNTRTLLTELGLDNTGGKLVSGMYAIVSFPPTKNAVSSTVLIKGDAIAIRHDRPEVATIVNGRVHFVPVTIGRDYGTTTEITSGLKPGDVIIVNVTDDVVEGARVQPHMAAANGGAR